MLPKVTVVTVTYNAADCVEMTLKSVIAQTYSNLEYIGRNYFIKNLGFSELTKEDIESHLVF